jgi:hypothetical protein
VLLAILGVRAMRDSSGLRASRRGRRTELTVGAVLLILSVAIHARGAWSWDTVLWNYFPVDVDRAQARLWDWRQPQWLAGVFRPLDPGAQFYDPRRP